MAIPYFQTNPQEFDPHPPQPPSGEAPCPQSRWRSPKPYRTEWDRRHDPPKPSDRGTTQNLPGWLSYWILLKAPIHCGNFMELDLGGFIIPLHITSVRTGHLQANHTTGRSRQTTLSPTEFANFFLSYQPFAWPEAGFCCLFPSFLLGLAGVITFPSHVEFLRITKRFTYWAGYFRVPYYISSM